MKLRELFGFDRSRTLLRGGMIVLWKHTYPDGRVDEFNIVFNGGFAYYSHRGSPLNKLNLSSLIDKVVGVSLIRSTLGIKVVVDTASPNEY